MSITRTPATSMSAFTLGTTEFIADLKSASITRTLKDEDASAARDQDEYAWGVKQSWQVEAEIDVTATAAAMLKFGQSVALVWNTGSTTYTGQALVTQGVHTSNDASLQKQRIVLKGQGPITIS